MSRIEPSRRHGPFDSRSGNRPVRVQSRRLEVGKERHARLDWYAFVAEFFPDRERHDFEVIAAYEAQDQPVAEGALAAWEWEGGRVEPVVKAG